LTVREQPTLMRRLAHQGFFARGEPSPANGDPWPFLTSSAAI
jgi:hypothetical protein